MILTRLPLLALLATGVAAQAADNRFVPADAQIVARIAAPAKWKAQFAGTGLAKALGGQALAPMLGQLDAGFEQALEEMKAEGMDADLLEGLVRDYQGDIVVGVRIDLEDLAAAIEDERPPAMAMTWTLTPDGEYDLAALGAALSRLAEEKNGNEMRDVVVGEHTLRVDAESDIHVVLPTMIDGHLMMMFATDAEREAPRMLAAEDRHAATGAGKALFLHVDAQHGVGRLIDIVQQKMEEDPSAPPIDMVQVLTDLGLGCLRSFELGVSADGDHAEFEVDLRCSSESRGLLGMFVLDHGPLKSLRYVPPSAPAFSCQAFDLGALYRTVQKVWGAFDGLVPMSFDDVEAMFAEATTVRLREDLFDQLGDELLYTSDPAAQDDLEDASEFEAMFGASCYALTLRDGKAFGEALEKALRSRGLHAARKSEDYQGVTVYEMRLFGALKLEYAVTPDLLLLAAGTESAGRQLRAILDARSSPAEELPESVASLARTVPAGWNGVAVTPMASILLQLSKVLEQAPADEIPPEARTVLGLFGLLGREMKQVGVDDAVQFSWASPTGIRILTRL